MNDTFNSDNFNSLNKILIKDEEEKKDNIK